jgi:hypothetical protein
MHLSRSTAFAAWIAVFGTPLGAQQSALERLFAPPPASAVKCAGEARDLERDTRRERVDFDRGDDALWARGVNYKMRFGANASFVPFLSSSAPRNYPLEFRVAQLSVAGESIAFEAEAPARLDGICVSYDRGALFETYTLEPRAVEQSFTLPERLGTGEIALTLALDTQLVAARDGAAWRFANEYGEVRYGAAKAIDARGRELALPSEIVDGRLTLRVPAAFASRADYPLLIDPVIAAFGIEATPAESFSPDVAFDASGTSMLYVWQSAFSANDHDVWGDMYDLAGAPLYRGGWIDMTANFWGRPRCANNGATNRFLVVAHVLNNATGRVEVWGRTRDTLTALLSPQFKIAGGAGFDLLDPDVGGDPYPTAPSYFLVVYERIYSFGQDHDVHAKLVSAAGALASNTIEVDASLYTYDSVPAVSRSNGAESWNLAWQRASPAGGNDIFGARVAWDGAVANPSFPIDVAAVDHKNPAVSSAQTGSPRWLVAYEEDFGSDHDIVVSALEGASVRATLNMSSYDGTFWYQDQRRPALDTDGSRFVCVYSELFGSSAVDYDVYATELLFNGASLVALAAHQTISADYGVEIDARIAAAKSSLVSGSSRSFAVALAREPDGAMFLSNDILGARYESSVGGAVASFCDGANVACPCGNGSSTGGGCPNSAHPAGAVLSWGGVASTSSDTLQLFCSGLPSGVSCLFFQGSGSINGALGAPFGDGVRCAASPIRRLGTKLSSPAGGALYPALGDASISVAGAVPLAGATVVYQAWYRNSANFCTAATTNYSNALVVAWTP